MLIHSLLYWHYFGKIIFVQASTMKKIILICIVASSLAFANQGIIDDMVSAFKSGSASRLAGYFDNMISLSLPGKSDSYSKTQAEMILKEFFDNNGVKDFGVIHKGDNSGSQFVIGMLQTKNGSYRTTIFIRSKGDKQVLQEIKVEPK